MNAICPVCGGMLIGFPVPDAACAVRVEGSLSRVTLINATSGQFLDVDDLDHEHAKCLDCNHLFDATVGRR